MGNQAAVYLLVKHIHTEAHRNTQTHTHKHAHTPPPLRVFASVLVSLRFCISVSHFVYIAFASGSTLFSISVLGPLCRLCRVGSFQDCLLVEPLLASWRAGGGCCLEGCAFQAAAGGPSRFAQNLEATGRESVAPPGRQMQGWQREKVRGWGWWWCGGGSRQALGEKEEPAGGGWRGECGRIARGKEVRGGMGSTRRCIISVWWGGGCAGWIAG